MEHVEALEREVGTLREKLEALGHDLDERTRQRDDALASARTARLLLHDVGFELRGPGGEVVPVARAPELVRNAIATARTVTKALIKMHRSTCQAKDCTTMRSFEELLITYPPETEAGR